MFHGQLLIQSTTRVFSPWFPRQGDDFKPTVEVIDIKRTAGDFKVHVFTKSSETTGNGTNADATLSLSLQAAGTDSAIWQGKVNELVRYQFDLSTMGSGDWVLFRMLDPVWYDAVKA